AVSARIRKIIDFQNSRTNVKLSKRIYKKLLEMHCDYLYNDKNYKNNNHGIMMDESLIIASIHISNKDLREIYLNKAFLSIKVALYRDFTRKVVHLENSPEYHLLVLKLFKRIQDHLENTNFSFDKEMKDILKRAELYRHYIIKPDGKFPMIGDTGTIQNKKIKKMFTDFIDYEAGIAIIHNKNYITNSDSTYLTLSAGYKSLTHKHKDDLSINLFLNGRDVLIDSGKYNY